MNIIEQDKIDKLNKYYKYCIYIELRFFILEIFIVI